MKIQINTGHNIQGNETLISEFSNIIESSLSRVSEHVSTVEVHFKDEGGNKKGKNDKRCMIEAHIEGRKPIAVSEHADNLSQALDGAIVKLLGMIESILDRQRDQSNIKTIPSASELEISEEK